MQYIIPAPVRKLAVAAGLIIAAPLAFAGSSNINWSITVGSPAPVYVAPPVVYVQPQPVYMQPQPVYVRPQPVYVQPQQVYVQPHPVYVQPGTVVHIGTPIYVQDSRHRKSKHRHWKHDRRHDYRY